MIKVSKGEIDLTVFFSLIRWHSIPCQFNDWLMVAPVNNGADEHFEFQFHVLAPSLIPISYFSMHLMSGYQVLIHTCYNGLSYLLFFIYDERVESTDDSMSF